MDTRDDETTQILREHDSHANTVDEGADGRLKPAYKSFVNLNFKVEDWYQQRFKFEASLRALTNKELLEACFQAYLNENGGTIDRPRQDLVDRFKGRRTNTRRSRGPSLTNRRPCTG